MVSSGQVLNDLSKITSIFSQYKSIVSELSSSWKGPSYDNLVSKANEFCSSYSSTLESQMNKFANACDLYEKYITAKSNYNSASSNYNSSHSNNDASASSRYSSLMTKYKTEMNELKTQIEACLSAVRGNSLTSSSSSSIDVSSTTTNTAPELNLNLNQNTNINGTGTTSYVRTDENGKLAYFTDSDGKVYTIYNQGEIYNNQDAWGVSWEQNDKCTRCSLASVLSGYTEEGAKAALRRNASWGSSGMVDTINECSDGKLHAEYVRYNSNVFKEVTANGGHGLVYINPGKGKSGKNWTTMQHAMAILDYREDNGGEIFISTTTRQPDDPEKLWVPYDEFDNILRSNKVIVVNQVK